MRDAVGRLAVAKCSVLVCFAPQARTIRAQTNAGSKGLRQIGRQRGCQGGATGPSLAHLTSVRAPRTRSANLARSYPRTAQSASIDAVGRLLGWS